MDKNKNIDGIIDILEKEINKAEMYIFQHEYIIKNHKDFIKSAKKEIKELRLNKDVI